MKTLKTFGELNDDSMNEIGPSGKPMKFAKAKPVPTVFVPPIDESVAGSSDALVVYFDYDLVKGFGAEVKKLIDECQLETISIKGNILVVAEGEGPKGGLKKFKKALGL
jgi:hypothetical protein